MRRSLLLPFAVSTLAATAPLAGAPVMHADFSAVTSIAKARALAAKGSLVPILLFPKEFGGRDEAENRAYVTPEAAQARLSVIATMDRMIRDGALDQMMIEPDYKGNSIIPARIHFKARHSGKHGSFEPTIEIW